MRSEQETRPIRTKACNRSEPVRMPPSAGREHNGRVAGARRRGSRAPWERPRPLPGGNLHLFQRTLARGGSRVGRRPREEVPMRQFSSFRSVASVLVLSLSALVGSPPALAEKPPEWFVDETKLPFTPLPGATAHWGVLGGAGFRAEVPGNWNGDLEIWAHGFRGPGLDLN